MHPLKHTLPSAHHSHSHPSLHLLISLSAPLSVSLSPPMSFPHPSFTAFCNNSVTSCRKSHGSWSEKSDLKQSQDGSSTARAFLITQQHDGLSFISLDCKPVPPSLSASSLLLSSFSPPHSTPIMFATSKWLNVQRQRKRRNAWETEMLGSPRGGEGGWGGWVQSGEELLWCHICCRPAGWQWKAGMCHTAEQRGRAGSKIECVGRKWFFFL